MATTSIFTIHKSKNKSVKQSICDRIGYILNPDKTEKGEYVKCFGCDMETADSQFLLSQKQYEAKTGRKYNGTVLAYHIRQSFLPGEVTPEQANEIGCEFASRYLKGKFQYIVATHTDKQHIHNHIIVNPVAIDCSKKFRNKKNSYKEIQKLSDKICEKYKINVIDNPQKNKTEYVFWKGYKDKPTNRDLLRQDIDKAMEQKPKSLNELLTILQSMGYSIRRGKHISLRHLTQKGSMRLDSLGNGYTQDDLVKTIIGETVHRPTAQNPMRNKTSLLIDIHKKMAEGKGGGYEQWAKVFNLKQMAQTVMYIQENKLETYDDFNKKLSDIQNEISQLESEITDDDKQMQRLKILRQHILDYAKNSKILTEYKKSGYSKSYYNSHKTELDKIKNAQAFFKTQDFKDNKLPKVKDIEAEFNSYLEHKKSMQEEIKKLKSEQKELITHKINIETILEISPDSIIESERSKDYKGR